MKQILIERGLRIQEYYSYCPGDGGHHPPRRERGAAAPEVPEHKATVAQGEGEVGEVGAEEGIEPSPESMEE